MKLAQSTQKVNVPTTSKETMAIPMKTLKSKRQKPESQDITFGQKLADKLASKVGSWPFLIGQTAVLAGWVGINLTPGVPHWDESPFILLNLVFSFASAYTAPIVLMSQNRQSDEDRKNAADNHKVNLQAAHNIEMLHEKLDELYSQKFSEIIELIKQQQQSSSQVVSPAENLTFTEGNQIYNISTPEKASTVVPNLQIPFLVHFSPINLQETNTNLLTQYQSMSDTTAPQVNFQQQYAPPIK